MAERLQYELCPETGIGCIVMNQESGLLKVDLMPDEAAELRELVKAGNWEGARALIASVDTKAESAMDDATLQALVKEMV